MHWTAPALAILLVAPWAGLSDELGTEAERHFREQVWPLFEARCVSCHGPERARAGLRLDSREALLRGGQSGPAILPARPAESLVLQAVLHTKPDLEMPPKEKLTPADIAILERWITRGAPWPETGPAPTVRPEPPTPGERFGDAWADPRNPIAQLWNGNRLDLWSLKPRVASLPPVRETGVEADHSVDRFLPPRGSEPDRRTLLRRLSFDLTGLPPSPPDVAAFEGDPDPAAYARAVERLLDSPAYGEHQARQWLDVVRYSDSNGFDWDEYRPEAWRFRDYVVRSFNADKPFDVFLHEQLAGDELLEGPPTTAAEQDRLIATGYLRLGPQDNSAALFNEQARARAEWMFDLVETTGSAFLGLTLSCARCHDHKFDPVSQADYFRLRAFFEPLRYADDVPLDLAPEQEAIRQHNAALDARRQPLATRREARLRAVKERLRHERLTRLTPEEQALLRTPPAEVAEDLEPRVIELRKQIEPSDADGRQAFTEEEQREDEVVAKEIEAIQQQRRAFTRGLLATDTTEAVSPTRILFLGNPAAEREAVEPGFLSVLDPNPAAIAKPPNPHTTGRRLALARWLTSPDHPLTARVLVNRIWQQHFGRGLVETANDFGLVGARPSHPELLDWLADALVRDGWSVKKLHRLILTSAAYRERAALRRLSAEQLRDAMLATAGRLVPSGGGPPVWPELPAEVLQANPAFLDDNAERTKGWYPSPPDRQGVRTLYLIQKRTVRVPFLEAFDLPENNVSCPRRPRSTVAPQALSLLNSPFALQTAAGFAERVEREAGPGPEDRIARAFALAFQRAPTITELARCRAFLAEAPLVELCRALLNVNEFVYLD
jgi:mono/diheme cytochrome c family protein